MKKHLLFLFNIFFINATLFSQNISKDFIDACLQNKVDEVKAKLISEKINVNSYYNHLTPLHYASGNGNYEVIKILIENGADVNTSWAKYSVTPLHLAAQNGHAKVVDLLLANEADIEATTEEGKTAVQLALENNQIECAKVILNFAKKNEMTDVVEVADDKGNNLLHTAVQVRNIDLCKEILLINNEIINEQNNWGCTPLYLASINEDGDMVKTLLANGADVNIKILEQKTYVLSDTVLTDIVLSNSFRPEYNTVNIVENWHWYKPWHVAAGKGNTKILALLLENHMEEAKEDEYLLFEAIRSGSEETVKKCLEIGTDINRENENGKTPLFTAVEDNKNFKIVKMLLSAGADPNVKDESSRTPLHFASSYGNIENIKILIENGAEINAEDQYLWKPLHFAVKEGHLDAIKLLIENNADINAKTDEGYTSLIISAYNGYNEIFAFLLSKGAEINLKDNNEKSILHYAAEIANLDLIELIVKSYYRIGESNNLNKNEFDYLFDNYIINSQIFPEYNVIERIKNILKILIGNIKHNNDLLVKLIEEETPILQCAILIGDFEFTKTLLDLGADVDNNYAFELVLSTEQPDQLRDWSLSGAITSLFSSGTTTIYFNCPPVFVALDQSSQIFNLLLDKQANLNTILTMDGINLLHKAVVNNQIDEVKRLCSLDQDLINEKDIKGQTPFAYAVRLNNLEIVKYLISQNAEYDEEILVSAIQSGSLDMLKYFIDEKSLEINSQIGPYTTLQWAVLNGDFNMVKYLVSKGADINVQTEDDMTALHIAAQYGYTEICEFLESKNALHLDAEITLWDKMKEINEIGEGMKPGDIVAGIQIIATLFSSNTSAGWKPIHFAAMGGHYDVVKLLSKTEDIKSKTEDGISVLHAGAIGNSIEILQFYLESDTVRSYEFSFYSIDDDVNYYGNFPYYKLSSSKVNISDRNGWTPLHWANLYECDQTIDWLIKNGANIDSESAFSVKISDTIEIPSGSKPEELYGMLND